MVLYFIVGNYSFYLWIAISIGIAVLPSICRRMFVPYNKIKGIKRSDLRIYSKTQAFVALPVCMGSFIVAVGLGIDITSVELAYKLMVIVYVFYLFAVSVVYLIFRTRQKHEE